MPALWIRCTKCETLVHTGVHMRRETFEATDLTGHVAQCVKCRTYQSWSKGDVDPASFVRPKTSSPLQHPGNGIETRIE